MSNWLLVLLSLATHMLQLHGCLEKGWFGENCIYKCHCPPADKCDVKGKCESEICEPGWFGSTCQHKTVKLLDQAGGDSLPDWLTDNKATTCNPEPNQRSLKLKLPQPRLNFWIRLHTKYVMKDVLTYETKFRFATLSNPKDIEKCEMQVLERRHGKCYEMRCTTKKAVSYIYIEGGIVAKLCSLYLSEGRQITLGHIEAPPSSLENKDILKLTFLDSLVAGGIENENLTDRETIWSKNFTFPVVMEKIVMYCPKESGNLSEYQTFTQLHLWQGEIKSITNVTVSQSANKEYIIFPTDKRTEPITRLEIVSSTVIQLLLSVYLCDVQVFGEFICPPRMFGLNCSMHCNCFISEAGCDVATGQCLSGCAGGYRGDDCWTKCRPGTYGYNCKKRCSKYCKFGQEACDHITGFCLDGCKGPAETQLCIINVNTEAKTTENESVIAFILLSITMLAVSALCIASLIFTPDLLQVSPSVSNVPRPSVKTEEKGKKRASATEKSDDTASSSDEDDDDDDD
ncbi:multiple epidermal growth factor-like domains 6 [Plakobranchus ocellatus]|uniref:Multiple epidermal growth factor-like domains 6 n=1 Tax=Plakobranchus ocellatus TaxID=259542 RepID=A0AAV4AYS2_9GAST|nr:multiple epidermal growth factor-like domains 6 [Plakobranchus ocellatus]